MYGLTKQSEQFKKITNAQTDKTFSTYYKEYKCTDRRNKENRLRLWKNAQI